MFIEVILVIDGHIPEIEAGDAVLISIGLGARLVDGRYSRRA
jgi:hypothetical protein